MRNVFVIGFACIALAGCNSSERAAKAAVLEELKDPDSAKWGEFTLSKEGKWACLGVNAKNSMGGYTGEQQNALQKDKKTGEWQPGAFLERTHEDCVETINRWEKEHFGE